MWVFRMYHFIHTQGWVVPSDAPLHKNMEKVVYAVLFHKHTENVVSSAVPLHQHTEKVVPLGCPAKRTSVAPSAASLQKHTEKVVLSHVLRQELAENKRWFPGICRSSKEHRKEAVLQAQRDEEVVSSDVPRHDCTEKRMRSHQTHREEVIPVGQTVKHIERRKCSF